MFDIVPTFTDQNVGTKPRANHFPNLIKAHEAFGLVVADLPALSANHSVHLPASEAALVLRMQPGDRRDQQLVHELQRRRRIANRGASTADCLKNATIARPVHVLPALAWWIRCPALLWNDAARGRASKGTRDLK